MFVSLGMGLTPFLTAPFTRLLTRLMTTTFGFFLGHSLRGRSTNSLVFQLVLKFLICILKNPKSTAL